MFRWMDGWTGVCVCVGVRRWIDRWIEGRRDGRIDEWMDWNRVGGWIDRRLDKLFDEELHFLHLPYSMHAIAVGLWYLGLELLCCCLLPRIVTSGYYSEKAAAKCVKEMLEAVRVRHL